MAVFPTSCADEIEDKNYDNNSSKDANDNVNKDNHKVDVIDNHLNCASRQKSWATECACECLLILKKLMAPKWPCSLRNLVVQIYWLQYIFLEYVNKLYNFFQIF